MPLLLLNRSTWIKVFTEIVLFSSIYTDVLYLLIGDFPFSYPDAINLYNNPGYASAAFNTFITAFVIAFAATAVLFAALQQSLKIVTISYNPYVLFVFIALQLFLFLYSKTNPGITDFFPSIYRVSGNLINAKRIRAEAKWRRQEVKEEPGSRLVKHVFLVVDESVTGSALSINGFPLSTTPFLKANTEKFINFGTATSFTNFSAGSNLALITGMLLSDLPDEKYISLLKPSLFQYARKAGYQTFLLDGQSSDNRLQNYTTSQDLAFIDSLYQPASSYPSLPSYHRDSVLGEKIAAIAGLAVPTFTYVNKWGAHWPFHTNFPSNLHSSNFHNPQLSTNESSVSYYKSLYWNVDRFWQQLVEKLSGDNEVLIVYTADHGENFTARSFKITHASIYETEAIEGLVPLLVFDQANFFPGNFTPVLNKYTHQSIFPTLLLAMGYNKNFVRGNYGQTLLEIPSNQVRWFLTGDLFGRGKNQQIFVD